MRYIIYRLNKKSLMKYILKFFLVQVVLLSSISLYAQVGIGTTTPDVSSILDISSASKGFLMPRLTTLERDEIVSPATGLMIYNTTLNDGQLNIGTRSVPIWIGMKSDVPKLGSVSEGNIISTMSTSNLLVSGMTISPPSGTFIISFNAQSTIKQTFSSVQGIIDMDLIYQDLIAIPATNTTHPVVFGSGEVLFPGVYDVVGATSITGTLTLDGGGDPNSVFIIRSPGAFTTTDSTTVNLINGASSNNVFWVSAAALSTAANTILKGSLVSNIGAISLGANTSLEGRMFTSNGALSVGVNSILTIPSGVSPINLRALSSFAMFTSSGAVSSGVTSIITGDVSTSLGALTIAGTHFGVQYPVGTESIDLNSTTTYGIYQNGTEVVNSSRAINSSSSVVFLQAMVTTLSAGEVIEVRWKVDVGEATLGNRTLTYHQ